MMTASKPACWIVGALLGLWALPSPGQSPSMDPAAYVDRFMSHIEAGNYGSAIDEFYTTLPANPDELKKLRAQFVGLPDLVGEFRGHELISEAELSPRFVEQWLLVYFDRQPLSFRFAFYRPRDVWQPFAFEFNTDALQVLRELAVLEMAGGGDEEAPPEPETRTLRRQSP